MGSSVDTDIGAVTTTAPSDRKAGFGPNRKRARWEDARIAEIIDEAPDAVTLRLRLEESTGFLPGQYYNVRLAVPGRPGPVQRAYSIASPPVPDPSTIDLGVREIAGGFDLAESGPGSFTGRSARSPRPGRAIHLDGR